MKNMQTLLKIVGIAMLMFAITACAPGDETSDTTINLDTTTVDNSTGDTSDTNDTTDTTNQDADTDMICETANGIVGCWETSCLDTQDGISKKVVISFRADGTFEKELNMYLTQDCSDKPVSVSDPLDYTYLTGDPVTTDTGTQATELEFRIYIPGNLTPTQIFTIFDIVNDQICFPDLDYNWNNDNSSGFTFGTRNPDDRQSDINYNECMTRVVQ